MRWEGHRESENIEDRRSEQVSNNGIFAPRGALAFILYNFGIGRGIALLILAYLILSMFGYNPSRFFFGDGALVKSHVASIKQDGLSLPPQSRRDHFIATILAETEDVWTAIFRAQDMVYKKPILVRFTGQIESACGFASAAMGPFYCSLDNKLYLDDSFFDELAQRFEAPGEFAQAYVIAHEVGHHVQNLFGLLDKVNNERSLLPKKEANSLSVKLELQADCYAGIWAHYTEEEGLLEPGDIASALKAAYQIGDDMLERKAQGYIIPDSFTHGTSKQRVYWFNRGYQKGTLNACNSFSESAAGD